MMTKPASLLKTTALLIALLLWCGCGKPPMLVQKYILEYPAPVIKATPLEESLKVQQFEVAQAFNTHRHGLPQLSLPGGDLQLQPLAGQPGLPGHRLPDPGLRDSRLFKAVLPADSPTKARFALEGGVEEIQEVDQGAVWQASLALNITLLDTDQETITKRVLFQKNYRAAEPLTEKTPAGLAQAMSRAMERLSARDHHGRLPGSQESKQ